MVECSPDQILGLISSILVLKKKVPSRIKAQVHVASQNEGREGLLLNGTGSIKLCLKKENKLELHLYENKLKMIQTEINLSCRDRNKTIWLPEENLDGIICNLGLCSKCNKVNDWLMRLHRKKVCMAETTAQAQSKDKG